MEQAAVMGSLRWFVGVGVGVLFAGAIGFVVWRINPSLDEREGAGEPVCGAPWWRLPAPFPRWQVVVASLCSGLLAALFALDLDNTGVRDTFSHRSVVSATATGILLLGITLLVAEAFIERARKEELKRTTRDASKLVMVTARRGAGNIAGALRIANGAKSIVRVPLPEPMCEQILMAADAAQESHQALVGTVGIAVTMTAPAGDAKLGEGAVALLAASNELTRTLMLYATGTNRLFNDATPTVDDVKRRWAKFAKALLDFNSQRSKEWLDQLEAENYKWLKDDLDESCKWLEEREA